MNNIISKETFDHLVDLAALQLDETEAEYLRQQLNNQLNAIHELEAIPLDEDVLITSHGVPYTLQTSPKPRKDVWAAYPNPEEILRQAPEATEEYFIVPEIPHTDLE
jgi:aspartyl-tRNA(Asn)/glutamyl-tRNA(Gln) amidotransferase subunit C